MQSRLPLHPEQASTIAQNVDHLYYFLTAVDLFFTGLIFLIIFYFAVKYRRAKNQPVEQITGNIPLEMVWIGVPVLLTVVMFLWGSSLSIRNSRPPAAASEIFV